jgi:hypothetical protein
MILHATSAMAKPVAKITLLRAAALAGDWPRALSIAAKFYDLGDSNIAITRAHNALQSPHFYRAINQDPKALVAAGIEALRIRYQPP